MAHELIKEAKDKMQKSLDSFRQELAHIRTGRASIGLLDSIEVDAYGSKMKVNQVGNITAPEPRMLVIAPWDKALVPAIERAIIASPLGLTPSNDGHLIRIPFPQLTEERRRDLVKMAGKLAEETRVAMRNVRRHVLEAEKKLQKDGQLPEDEARKMTDEVQKLTDEYIGKVEEAFKGKEAEIMEV